MVKVNPTSSSGVFYLTIKQFVFILLKYMKNLSLYVFGIVISIAIVLFTPKYFLQLLGCWQIGSWIGDFIDKRLEK